MESCESQKLVNTERRFSLIFFPVSTVILGDDIDNCTFRKDVKNKDNIKQIMNIYTQVLIINSQGN